MKKFMAFTIFSFFLFACNDSGNENNGNDRQTPNANSDSLPRNNGNDTSSYERMQNRVTDTAQQ